MLGVCHAEFTKSRQIRHRIYEKEYLGFDGNPLYLQSFRSGDTCAGHVFGPHAGWVNFGLADSTGRVPVRIDPNPGNSSRAALLQMDYYFLLVTQAGGLQDASVSSIDPLVTRNLPVSGGEGSIAVNGVGACLWTVVNYSNVPWLSFTSEVSGTGKKTVRFRVASRLGGADGNNLFPRGAILKVGDMYIAIIQAGTHPGIPGSNAPFSPAGWNGPVSCSFAIGNVAPAVTAGGGTYGVAVSTSCNCQWTAKSEPAWITITSGASGIGSGVVTFTVDPNPGPDPRPGRLIVAGKPVPIIQPPPPTPQPCPYSAAPNFLSFEAGPRDYPIVPGAKSFTVSATCAWQINTSQEWILAMRRASSNIVDVSVKPEVFGIAIDQVFNT